MKFTIQGELPDLNTYTNDERGNKYAGAGLKKKATNKVAMSIKDKKTINRTKFKRSVCFYVVYYCKDRRKDKDNIAFAKKFIFDGLQQAGVIENDGWNNIESWEERFEIDKENPRIEVELWSE